MNGFLQLEMEISTVAYGKYVFFASFCSVLQKEENEEKVNPNETNARSGKG